MNKKCYRYFGGLLSSQERWLNQMAAEGWRLAGTGKLSYEFESCAPGEYEYRVEFVGQMAYGKSKDYKAFLYRAIVLLAVGILLGVFGIMEQASASGLPAGRIVVGAVLAVWGLWVLWRAYQYHRQAKEYREEAG